MKCRHVILSFIMMAATSGAAFAAGTAVYSKAQAAKGQAVYSAQCASCHGSNLEGTVGPALKGGQFQQMAAAQQLTGASLLGVISQSMPKTNPGSLSATQYDDVTAYILQQNGYPAGDAELAAGKPGVKALSLAGAPSGQ